MIDNLVRKAVYVICPVFLILTHHVAHVGSVSLALLTLLGLWVMASKARRPAISPAEKWMLLSFAAYTSIYLLSFGLNTMTGNLVNPHTKYLEKHFWMLYFIPVFYLFRYLRLNPAIFWWASAIGAVITGLYTLQDTRWLTVSMRVKSAYHQIIFGDLALVMAFFSLTGLKFFWDERRGLIALPLGGFCMGLLACIYSGTRGAWIALPVMVFLILWQYGPTMRPVWRFALGGFICMVFVLPFFFPQTQAMSRVRRMVNEVDSYFKGNFRGGADMRLEIWRASMAIIKSNSVLGAGPGGFNAKADALVKAGKVQPNVRRFTNSHNIYFSAMVECGVLGLLATLTIFILPLALLITLRKAAPHRDAVFAGLILICGYLHFGLTETITARSAFVSFYVINLALLYSFVRSEPLTHTA